MEYTEALYELNELKYYLNNLVLKLGLTPTIIEGESKLVVKYKDDISHATIIVEYVAGYYSIRITDHPFINNRPSTPIYQIYYKTKNIKSIYRVINDFFKTVAINPDYHLLTHPERYFDDWLELNRHRQY